MGVLNVTPDSFSDGGRYLDPARAVEHGLELARQGADWIDVGGESTRPGSQPVSAEEELRRVLPVIQSLRRKLPGVPFSIDTTKAEVAEQAIRAGANILNDISGLRFDPRLAEIACRTRAPLILMHSRGRPATMQRIPFARDVWRSVAGGWEASIGRALAAGVERSQLILDPGLGFGKSRRQNYEILSDSRGFGAFAFRCSLGRRENLLFRPSSRAKRWTVRRRKVPAHAMGPWAGHTEPLPRVLPGAQPMTLLSPPAMPVWWSRPFWAAHISCVCTTPQLFSPPCALQTPCSTHAGNRWSRP